MEKLPTIILPDGCSFEDSPAPALHSNSVSVSALGKLAVQASASILRLGGIRMRCTRPQQLAEEFYVKRLGMQELALIPTSCTGAAGAALVFGLVLPQRQLAPQLMHQASLRSQRLGVSMSNSRNDLSAPPAENAGADRLSGSHLGKIEAFSREGSRRASLSSQQSGRNNGSRSASTDQRFAAFDFFSVSGLDAVLGEGIEGGEASALPQIRENWLRRSFGQFVLEYVLVHKANGAYKPYEHQRSDTFSRIAYCVSDVNAAAVNLCQHMVRTEPAGQFLDMAYGAGFLDPQNFRGRLLQYISEYSMVSRRAALSVIKVLSEQRALDTAEGRNLENQRAERTCSPSSDSPEAAGCISEAARRASPVSCHSAPREMELAKAELEGCLPPPTSDEMTAVEGALASPRVSLSIRVGTLPLATLPVLHHVELRCVDADKMLRFYEEALGMTLIEKKVAQDFGFTLYFLAFATPTQTSLRYWLWLQKFSCVCIKAFDDQREVEDYRDLLPSECGFLGLSFICADADEQRLLNRLNSKGVHVEYVEDEVYGRKVMLLRDPQNVPIRIVVAC